MKALGNTLLSDFAAKIRYAFENFAHALQSLKPCKIGFGV